MTDHRRPDAPAETQSTTGNATEKSRRLAAALRANLARRKAQTRGRRASDGAEGAQTDEPNNEQE